MKLPTSETTIVLSAAAGLLGLLIAQLGIEALSAYGPADIPRIDETNLDTCARFYRPGFARGRWARHRTRRLRLI